MKPCTSQKEKIPYCPFVRESENFADRISSSHNPTPLQATPIRMVPLAESSDFEFKRIRVSEGGLGDESPSKKIRVSESVEDTIEVIAVESSDFDVIGENQELIKDGKSLKDIEGKKVCENSDSDGSLDSSKIEEEIAKIKFVHGNGCYEKRDESGVGGFEESKITEDSAKAKGGLRNCVDDRADVERRGKRRQFPVSIKGKDKNVGVENVVMETVGSKSGLLELINVLKLVAGNTGGDYSEDVDFLETAKKQGLTFPRPRWWPPEGDEW